MRAAAVAVVAVAAIAAVGAYANNHSTQPSTAAGPAPANATAELNALHVSAEDTGAHYRRADWGNWASIGHSRNTRDGVLAQHRGERPGCSGWTIDYTGQCLTDPHRTQIDHRVPVKEANRSGARNWTRAQRRAFYNDTANLVVSDVHSNESKGDDDPAHWRPANQARSCSYAIAWDHTKRKYRLTVDPAEKRALQRMLATCPR